MLSKGKKLLAYDYVGACSFYLGAIVTTLVCQGVAGVVAAALAKSNPGIASDGNFSTSFMIAVQIVNALFIYLFSRMRQNRLNFTYVKRESDGKGITPSVIIVPLVSAMLLMIGMYLPTIYYGYFTKLIGVPPSAGQIDLNTTASVVMIVLASVFLAPIMEETIYRGVLLHGLAEEKSAPKAVALSALAFMLMHMNVLQVVFQFALGIVGGFIALKAKRLLPSIILHSAANALALVFQLTPLGGTLASCVAWLDCHAAAAVFITLGLFVGSGAALFAVVRYGFELPETFGKIKRHFRAEKESATPTADEPSALERNTASETVSTTPADDGATDGKAVEMAKTVRREQARSDGNFKFIMAIGICVLMFVVNLVSVIVS